MELRHLRYFVAVAQRKGFREAARFLHVSQPAISKTLTQIAALTDTSTGLVNRISTNSDYNRNNINFQSKGGN